MNNSKFCLSHISAGVHYLITPNQQREKASSYAASKFDLVKMAFSILNFNHWIVYTSVEMMNIPCDVNS